MLCTKQSAIKTLYNKPSGTTWENALPIGNGKLGAMIYVHNLMSKKAMKKKMNKLTNFF